MEALVTWSLHALRLADPLAAYTCWSDLAPADRSFLAGGAPPPTHEASPETLAAWLAERTSGLRPVDPQDERAAARVARFAGLGPVEHAVLALLVAARGSSFLDECVGTLGTWVDRTLIARLGALLHLPEEGVRAALAPEGRLVESGLVQRPPAVGAGLGPWPPALGDKVIALALERRAGAPPLSPLAARDDAPGVADFPSLAAEAAVIVSLLREWTPGPDPRAPAPQILVHGAPGSGASAFGAAVAHASGRAVFAAPVDHREDEWTVLQRLREPAAPTVFLVDPPDGELNDYRTREALTEPPRHPGVWVTSRGDPPEARFDVIVAMAPSGPALRERLLTPLALPPDERAALAREIRLAPGPLTRAVAAARLTVGGTPVEALRTIAAGHPPSGSAEDEPARNAAFDAAFLHLDLPAEHALAGLGRMSSGAACLYGPPGTGKTWFAHEAIRRSGRPLRLYKASDLLDKWVGSTERNMARMFASAARDDGVLFLDEVDALAFDRKHAMRRWEVGLVDALLQGMDAYPGLIVCATNRYEDVDPAVRRRFVLKVRFQALTAAQRRALFCRTLSIAPDALPPSARAAVDAMAGLVVADFGLVERRAAVLEEPLTAGTLQDGLRAELEGRRSGSGNPVGFTAPRSAPPPAAASPPPTLEAPPAPAPPPGRRG